MITLSLLSVVSLKRRDLVWLVPSPAAAIEREFTNSNAVFPNDFYYKFGKKPAPIDSADTLPGTPPYVRIQTRYDAYQKYATKIKIGLEAFADLPTSSDTLLRSLRPMGLLANNLLATDSVTNEVLLARYYINEVYFQVADNSSPDVDAVRRNLNSYLIVVNRAISADVGPRFPLL